MRIEGLKVGDALVCVNERQYIFVVGRVYKIKLLEKDLVVFEGSSIKFGLQVLRYFKKKEEPKHTFNDLIDVAVQAYKDKVLSDLSLSGAVVKKLSYWGESFSDHVFEQHDDYTESINIIQSLYKETFVIESEEDLNRILYKLNPKIILKTGEVIPFIFKWVSRNNLIFEDQSGRNSIPFIFLKGATVERDRNV